MDRALRTLWVLSLVGCGVGVTSADGRYLQDVDGDDIVGVGDADPTDDTTTDGDLPTHGDGGDPISNPGGDPGGGDGGDSSGPGADNDAPSDPDFVPQPPFTVGGPGCGFDSAAFCETFDHLELSASRAGELPPDVFSGSRLVPQLPGEFLAGRTELPTCRGGLPTHVLPPSDYLLCDPISSLASRHLLFSSAMEAYGQSSLRPKRLFDFTDRTGTLRFDAELATSSPNYGLVSVSVTADPVGAPSYALYQNIEGGALPRNGFSVVFHNGRCSGSKVAVDLIVIYRDYEQEFHQPNSQCFNAVRDQLNRVELLVSKESIIVKATPSSADGVTFGTPTQVAKVDTALPMQRGYVQLNIHNHATMKYSSGHAMLAWTARFDNVGFDGPVIEGYAEYEFPDSLRNVTISGQDYGNGPYKTIGYTVPTSGLKLTFKDVDADGVTGARLAFNNFILPDSGGGKTSTMKYVYRINNGAWHERPATAAEKAHINAGHSHGTSGVTLELPPEEFVTGENVIDLKIENVERAYPPSVANVDLVLTKW